MSTVNKLQLLKVSQDWLASTKQNRVCACQNAIISDEVLLMKEGANTFFHGVVNCDSVWTCPYCSAKKSADNCADLKKRMTIHAEQGGTFCMFTFTAKHKASHRLDTLHGGMKKAFARFWAEGTVKRYIRKLKGVAKATAVEITVSQENGWHPHRHVILFIKSDDEELLKKINLKFQKLWQKCLEKQDLTCKLDIGFKLDYAKKEKAKSVLGWIAYYIAKFSKEMTLSNIKKTRKNENFQVFTLLQVPEFDKRYDWAVRRFREYARVMAKCHQFFYSRGLREMFPIEEELSPEKDENNVKTPLVGIPSNVYRRLSLDIRSKLVDLSKVSVSILKVYLDNLSRKFTWFKVRYLVNNPLYVSIINGTKKARIEYKERCFVLECRRLEREKVKADVNAGVYFSYLTTKHLANDLYNQIGA